MRGCEDDSGATPVGLSYRHGGCLSMPRGDLGVCRSAPLRLMLLCQDPFGRVTGIGGRAAHSTSQTGARSREGSVLSTASRPRH